MDYLSNSEPWDVIIIGAGPAGSSAAYRLAQRGLKTLILEKATMPRPKLCGGAVTEKALSYLDFSLPDELINCHCYGARVRYGGCSVSSKLGRRIAVLVTRSTFDHFLLKKAIEAGAEVVYESAQEVFRDGDITTVKTESGIYTAKVAIVAVGASSALIHPLRYNYKDNEIGFCLEQNYPVMNPDPYRDLKNMIEISFGVGKFGYGWVLNHGSYYSVGIGGLKSLLKNPLEVMRKFWVERGFPLEDLNPRGWPIPCGGINRQYAVPGIITVGDAAGFADAFMGEGIRYAIKSGQLAAGSIIDTLSNNANGILQTDKYTKQVTRVVHSKLKYALLFARFVYRYPNIFLRISSRNKKVISKYLMVLHGKLSYKSLLIWLLVRLPILIVKEFILNNKSEKYGREKGE
ncbi:MAG: geranylgeranyl reductase family protein [candidate division Zixibacteria bacterium]|nr:geranylgeranyl reductase family protein [candidate division Zixibacteria bacterium]